MLYSAAPVTAAPAMTLMGLGFHLRRVTKPTRKIASAIKSMLPKYAGNLDIINAAAIAAAEKIAARMRNQEGK